MSMWVHSYFTSDFEKSHTFQTNLSFFTEGKKNRAEDVTQVAVETIRKTCLETDLPKLNCNEGGEDAFYVAKKIVDEAPELFTLAEKIFLFILKIFSIDGSLYTNFVKKIVKTWTYMPSANLASAQHREHAAIRRRLDQQEGQLSSLRKKYRYAYMNPEEISQELDEEFQRQFEHLKRTAPPFRYPEEILPSRQDEPVILAQQVVQPVIQMASEAIVVEKVPEIGNKVKNFLHSQIENVKGGTIKIKNQVQKVAPTNFLKSLHLPKFG